MKATITADGTLVVKPENELEAYAIAQRANANMADWFNARVPPPNMMTDCSEYPSAFAPITVRSGVSA